MAGRTTAAPWLPSVRLDLAAATVETSGSTVTMSDARHAHQRRQRRL